MPEGDTIRRLADKISRRFAGEKCLRCVTRDPRLSGVDLAGATLIAADAIGKHLFIRFDNGNTLHSHLRMSGSWTVGPAAREPEWRRRVELWMQSGRLTGIDLPVVELLPTTQEDRVAGHLGPDLCGPDLPDLDEVVERLQHDPLAALATALARPTQRRRIRQHLRDRGALRRRCVTEPTDRHDRRFARSCRCRHRADPHQRRTRPAEHNWAPAGRRGPLDLRPARPAMPDLCDTARRLGRARQPVAPRFGVVPELPASGRRAQCRHGAHRETARLTPGPATAIISTYVARVECLARAWVRRDTPQDLDLDLDATAWWKLAPWCSGRSLIFAYRMLDRPSRSTGHCSCWTCWSITAGMPNSV